MVDFLAIFSFFSNFLSFCDKNFPEHFFKEKTRGEKKLREKNLDEKILRNKLEKNNEKTFTFRIKKARIKLFASKTKEKRLG